jgi:hypothetical protein
MPKRRKTFNAFGEIELRRCFEKNDQDICSQIERESEDYILNVNEIEYVNHLISEFSISPPVIDFENVSVTSYEKQISAEDFPEAFRACPEETFSRLAFVYYLPYAGEVDLLRCFPGQHPSWTTEVYAESQDLCFEVVSFREDAEEVKRTAEHFIHNMKSQLGYLTQEIEDYNASLPESVQQMFRTRKQRFLGKYEMLAFLEVPIRKRETLPETYAIPAPHTRKSAVAKPRVTERGYRPEPALDQLVYQEILQTIHDVGKVFERLPSTYSGKSEEELRDHLLLYLEPRFEGSATGETFNRLGKTDILIRYENSNVFIAECKFWGGQKLYLKTIDQLLAYLTWRDSKAAIVIFVRSKDFSSVLQAIEAATPGHLNYLGFVTKEDETWLNYRFHIRDDPNREVQLAVLLFHIPS